jgi:hypothetical protein
MDIVHRPELNRGLLARFDVQVSDDLALKHLTLSLSTKGKFRVFPPNLRGTNAAWLSPALAEQMTIIACAEYDAITGGQLPHETTGI